MDSRSVHVLKRYDSKIRRHSLIYNTNKYFGKIIDTHAHIYPEKIASKAVAAIGEFYDIPMGEDGTPSGLKASGTKIGVERYVVHSLATNLN